MSSKAEDIAKRFGLCTCDDIYITRKLTAPDCPWHAYSVEEAMKEIASIAFEEGFNNCLREIGIDNLNNSIYRQMRDLCKEEYMSKLFDNE